MKILTSQNYELIPLNEMTNVRFYTSVDPGSYVAPHWHDAVEIVCLDEGQLEFTLEQKTIMLERGQCIMVSPNVIHSTLCTQPNRAIVFQIPEAFLKKFIPNADRLDFSLTDPAPTPILQTNVDLLKDTLRKMQVINDLRPDGGVLRFNSLLFEVLFQLYHNFSNEVMKENFSDRTKRLERLKTILDYTAENYSRQISLAEIAAVAGFDRKYFCRFFKNFMGITFLEYQNKVRLAKIYEDLLSTDDKVSDILERHGFTNYKLFRKMFNEHFHTTPTALRKRQNQSQTP